MEAIQLAAAKAAAMALPPTSIVRRMILAEPDALPRTVFEARAETWIVAIFAESFEADVARRAGRNLPILKEVVERDLSRMRAGSGQSTK